jgi:adenylosuccinate synthase
MNNNITLVDVCCGLSWGDEGKGKIVSQLSKPGFYDFVCRWGGGNNAGHTIYVDGVKYKTHLIPSGVFFNKMSIIGPGCVINKEAFYKEIEYLKSHGFDTSLVKVSEKAHVVTDQHIEEDINKYKNTQGSTSKGIAPCYRDKYARIGTQVIDVKQDFEGYIWDNVLYGNVLCEGAQGFWLDIEYGNYPYVTSSSTLPYSSCSLGFPPQLIRKVIGAAKIYDTRSGIDNEFPETLLDDEELTKICIEGKEYGTTTGRRRKVNYMNLDKLIIAANVSGTTDIVISKVDILEKTEIFKLHYLNKLHTFNNIEEMKDMITQKLKLECGILKHVIYSDSPETI